MDNSINKNGVLNEKQPINLWESGLIQKVRDVLKVSKLEKQREKRKKEIKCIDDDVKNRIVEASENIPVDVKKIDWNAVFEINLWWKKYSIVDVNLNRYAGKYVEKYWFYEQHRRNGEISAYEIRWDNSMWNNKEFADYVKSREEEWFFMLSNNSIENLLWDLWKQANLNKEADEIAMLMYLIGIEWDYWLSMNGENSRSHLSCSDTHRATWWNCWWSASWGVILLSVQ